MYKSLTKTLGFLLIWFGAGWLALPFIVESMLKYVPEEGSVNYTASFALAGVSFLLSLLCFIHCITAKPVKIYYKQVSRCPKCDSEIFPGTEYCPYCGSFIKSS